MTGFCEIGSGHDLAFALVVGDVSVEVDGEAPREPIGRGEVALLLRGDLDLERLGELRVVVRRVGGVGAMPAVFVEPDFALGRAVGRALEDQGNFAQLDPHRARLGER